MLVVDCDVFVRGYLLLAFKLTSLNGLGTLDGLTAIDLEVVLLKWCLQFFLFDVEIRLLV